MDFTTNVKLLMNPLRQDMSTNNVKYFGGCYTNSKFYKNDFEGISTHLLNLTSLEFGSNLNGSGLIGGDNKMVPTILSLKNIINIMSNKLSTDSSQMSMTEVPSMMMAQTAAVFNSLCATDDDDSSVDNKKTTTIDEVRKSLSSPKRFSNNPLLPMKVKSMKKSPNLTFYRNLIEEISAERKLPTKSMMMMPQSNSIECNFIIIENPNNNSYEIRFKEAKRKGKHKFNQANTMVVTTGVTSNTLHMEHENEIPTFINFTNCEPQIIPDIVNISGSHHLNDIIHNNDFSDDDDNFIVFGDDDDDSDSDDDDDDHVEDSSQSPILHERDSNLKTQTIVGPVAPRSRLLSDCDSEDSFIIFAGDNDDDEEDEDENDVDNKVSSIYDDESGDEEESDMMNDSNDTGDFFDEPDCAEAAGTTRHTMQVWEENHMEEDDKSIEKKVHFKPDSELCEVHPMVKWSYAYQSARKGRWEEAARDRNRFQCRLRRSNEILKTVLATEHRNKIFTERFRDNDDGDVDNSSNL